VLMPARLRWPGTVRQKDPGHSQSAFRFFPGIRLTMDPGWAGRCVLGELRLWTAAGCGWLADASVIAPRAKDQERCVPPFLRL
jgi:hypothetical protein